MVLSFQQVQSPVLGILSSRALALRMMFSLYWWIILCPKYIFAEYIISCPGLREASMLYYSLRYCITSTGTTWYFAWGFRNSSWVWPVFVLFSGLSIVKQALWIYMWVDFFFPFWGHFPSRHCDWLLLCITSLSPCWSELSTTTGFSREPYSIYLGVKYVTVKGLLEEAIFILYKMDFCTLLIW